MHGGLIQYQVFVEIWITGLIILSPNPGPVINSTKTIQAPYIQDNVAIFGLNAGT